MPTRTPDSLIILSSDKLRQFALDALLQHVQLHINGTKCTLETVSDLILKASAARTSLSDVCDNTPGAPSGTATLGHLHEALPHNLGHLWHLEANLNGVLVANLKPRQLRVRCDVAIDLVLVPYHGEPTQNPEELRRSEAREVKRAAACKAETRTRRAN